MENMEDIVTLVAAVLAFITSVVSIIITIRNEQKRVKTETITHNRVDWIKDVRKLLMEFLEVHADSSLVGINRQKKLRIIRNKITLYFRKGINSYSKLTKIMDECILQEYDPDQDNRLIESAQDVLSGAWIRAKREAGINKKEDREFEELLGK